MQAANFITSPVQQQHRPASSILVTTVASYSGVYPSSILDPFIMGTQATGMLSFTARVFPANNPSGAPLMSHRQYLEIILAKSFKVIPGEVGSRTDFFQIGNNN